MKKRIVAFMSVIAMCMAMVTPALAKEPVEEVTQQIEISSVNPLYENQVVINDLQQTEPPYFYTLDEPEYVTDVDEFVPLLRSVMKEKMESVTIYYAQKEKFTGNSLKTWSSSLMEKVLAETENADEGDFLAWQYAGYRINAKYYSQQEMYYYTITINFTYYITAEQNEEFKEVADCVLDELDIKNAKSDYEKIKRIYHYICQNVTYDYAHLNNNEYKLQYTAYAALINKTAVCQGYANLFYYLSKKAGVNARIITGVTDEGENHAWNIVRLDDSYYNLDATWDAGKSNYAYFLKGSDNFTNHISDDAYVSPAFRSVHPISKTDYVEKSDNKCIHEWEEWKQVVDATYTQEGKKERCCIKCGVKESDTITKYVVEDLKLDRKNVEIYENATLKLTVSCKPIQPSTDEILWKSENQNVAIVDALGNVTAKGKGTTTISASVGGVEATCQVTVISDKWKQNSVGWWYQNDDGTYPANCWKVIEGEWYYFNIYGYRVENAWVGDYWLGEDGVMATNAWVDGGKYYVDANGIYVTGWLYQDGWYYLNTSGAKQTGWILVDGVYYYGDSGTGKLYTSRWLGDTYYLQNSGAMATGWAIIDGEYYYFDASGAKVTSQWIGNYYVKADGVMAKDEWIGNYYVDKNGAWVPGAK